MRLSTAGRLFEFQMRSDRLSNARNESRRQECLQFEFQVRNDRLCDTDVCLEFCHKNARLNSRFGMIGFRNKPYGEG